MRTFLSNIAKKTSNALNLGHLTSHNGFCFILVFFSTIWISMTFFFCICIAVNQWIIPHQPLDHCPGLLCVKKSRLNVLIWEISSPLFIWVVFNFLIFFPNKSPIRSEVKRLRSWLFDGLLALPGIGLSTSPRLISWLFSSLKSSVSSPMSAFLKKNTWRNLSHPNI